MKTLFLIPQVSNPIRVDHLSCYKPIQYIEAKKEDSVSIEVPQAEHSIVVVDFAPLSKRLNYYWDPDPPEELMSSPPVEHMTKIKRGRPKLKIDHDKIRGLKAVGFTNKQIAENLGTTERQIYRILKYMGDK